MTDLAAKAKPKRLPLTPDRILQAAIALMDRDGYSALSMRKLARSLGVEAMSLYDHFPSKDAMLQALRGHFYKQLTLEFPAGTPWHDQLEANMWELYRLGTAHPSFIAVHLHVLSVPESRQRGESDIALLQGAGFDEPEAAAALVALVSYVIGFLHRIVLVEHANRIAQIVRQNRDAAFQLGLRAILDGLRARLERG